MNAGTGPATFMDALRAMSPGHKRGHYTFGLAGPEARRADEEDPTLNSPADRKGRDLLTPPYLLPVSPFLCCYSSVFSAGSGE